MRVSILLLSLFLLQVTVWAAPSAVWWPSWEIRSSEELSLGEKYKSYPVPLMLDGDSKTAWVYSAKSQQREEDLFSARYGFVLTPRHPVTIDSLRIMNGQNYSRSRFFRNHRVTKIRVTQELPGNKKRNVTTETRLSDSMGWHTIRLPRHSVKSVKLEFIGITHSKAKGADVCISELELYDKGKKVSWELPQLVMHKTGIEGCETFLLINRHGREVETNAAFMGYIDLWTSDSHYVCSERYTKDEKNIVLWIADAVKGKIIKVIAENSKSDAYRITGNTLIANFTYQSRKHRLVFHPIHGNNI